MRRKVNHTIEEWRVPMTSSNALKCVVSDYETTTDEVAPRKPFFGNSEVKIGDFTQTKMGDFNA